MATGLSLKEPLPALQQSDRAIKSMWPADHLNRFERRRRLFGNKIRTGSMTVAAARMRDKGR